jgi:hypothetical protein
VVEALKQLSALHPGCLLRPRRKGTLPLLRRIQPLVMATENNSEKSAA